MIFDKNGQPEADTRRWVTGDIFGLEIPADAETLLQGGADFLTRAFQAAGTLTPDNRVSRIIESREFIGGGTGKKLVLTLAYEHSGADLPEQLFIKFSRNFENELWDRGRFMMVSEAHFAVMSRGPEFPVTVPRCLFADVEAASCTGLIITECISAGKNGVEPMYAKCLDYLVPEPLQHYRVILNGLATLAGAACRGILPPEFEQRFPFNRKMAAAMLAIRTPEEKLLQRASRMFDFIDRYPKLFPDNIRSAAFREQFMADLPDVVAAEGRMVERLFGRPEMIAFCHWNANMDNCWFWRDDQNALQCGFLDWANVGPLNVAQAVSGAISGAEPFIWSEHLDELLTGFIDEFAAQGGPRLDLEELRLHCLLIVAIGGVAYAMNAPIALARDIENLDALTSRQDPILQQHENARIQLHMMTKMLHVWETQKLGEVIRGL